ncbi:hypothetical protein LRQ11_27350 [Pseudomonas sp. MAFF 311095]|uniref:Uncharacterized protein n=1 Tax=Pseudomonas petroselini TaxID=2899822 RepID=A0ABS8QV46_9PSED|nr:hypothetical protein [Pseudomonas petroselini]MCD7039427.1 hypothetical protein [Pseudomonas petroselini]MCD7047104.1 hypothetical protein [Pseudomonas petroselini]MCD7069156.1 hypothetical protein [Pseudomonas petroselini]MCD7082308.1 hypothetical protein [Pseudomonas petroselini]
MEYLIGAILAGIIIFVVLVKSKTDKFNKLTRMHFPNWFALFSNSQMPENHGMARALILQTFHLAEEFGAITPTEKRELDVGCLKEDPIEILNGWLEHALPVVSREFGDAEIATSEARLIGVLMLVSVKGVRPERDLNEFLKRFN